jgi:hypothetical protein
MKPVTGAFFLLCCTISGCGPREIPSGGPCTYNFIVFSGVLSDTTGTVFRFVPDSIEVARGQEDRLDGTGIVMIPKEDVSISEHPVLVAGKAYRVQYKWLVTGACNPVSLGIEQLYTN